MCGITGFLDKSGQSTKSTLLKMTHTLNHRGPDDRGVLLKQEKGYVLGFGHTRLSIIDLSEKGHQPMTSHGITITYNGEVYNYKEIKEELERKGHAFTSNSDTEVIIIAYLEWGMKCLDKFIGMFAFALYDERAGVLYLVRDRAGVKPLYYYYDNNILIFGSELKSLIAHTSFKKQVDLGSLSLFLQFGYIPSPNAIFSNTKKVGPGSYIKFDINKNTVENETYWNVFDCYSRTTVPYSSEEEILYEMENILKTAFSYRMVADVPVGIFLSGGFDSSLVTAMLQTACTNKIKTFSIGFDEVENNEAVYARQIADYLGTDHYEHYCTKKEALDIFPQLPESYDEPFGDSSAIPTLLVSKLARKEVKVSLSADGGDEIFAGYTIYPQVLNFYKRFHFLPGFLKQAMIKLLGATGTEGKFIQNLIYNYELKKKKLVSLLRADNLEEIYKIKRMQFVERDIQELLIKTYYSKETFFDKKVDTTGEINTLLCIDYKTYLVDDILTKVDRATMSVGLEGRDPFLDQNIIEFAATIPGEYKISGNKLKYILKKIAYKHIPKHLLDRPKMGFAIPMKKWFEELFKSHLSYYLQESRIKNEQIFNLKKIRDIKKTIDGNIEVNLNNYWNLLMFEMWHERWM